tara:strand:- start:839 stop:1693 length:855 start_codon:yes stop_codon:yes gene_type:complete
MKVVISSFFTLILVFSSFGQQMDAYQIYTAKGKKTTYKKLVKAANQSDITLFGELHNNAIAHWLELEVLKSIAETKAVTVGAEMFEADNQLALNTYLTDSITAKGLDTSARLWNNFKTDYQPLVDFAKVKQFPFIATNVPRRYASKVYKGGFRSLDTISDLEKTWIAPLPIAYDSSLSGYVEMVKMMGGHGGDNLPKAQALKDATMAHFILANFNPNSTFIHYNGAYHSDDYQGIMWYLKLQKPELNYLTITTVTQADIYKLSDEAKQKADFIIVVDEDVTETY